MQSPGREHNSGGRRLAALAIAAVLVAFVALLGLVGTSQEPVLAQGEDDEFAPPTPIDQMIELPGECPMAAPIEPGHPVDCFFEILPYVDLGAFEYAEAFYENTYRRCHVESGIGGWDRLVCPDLFQNRFEAGPVEFDLQIGGALAESVASATFTWGTNASLSLFGDGEGESVVFDGRPLRWFSYTYESIDGLYLNVRDRNGVEIIDSLSVDVAEVFQSVEGSFQPDLRPGRYRIWPCVGATPATCEEMPGGRPFQVIDGKPLELVEGHNRETADRINVLFVSSGLERRFAGQPEYQLPELATTMLTIDGPHGLDSEQQLVDESVLASQLLWGPMAIEPLASNLDLFNFWYLPDDIADEVGLLFGGSDPDGDAGFDLPNLQITSLYNDGADFTSDARRTSFESVGRIGVPGRGQIRFGDARVWVPEFAPLSGVTTLAHEWGHGLFGLRDEYYGFDDRGIAVGFPNCAPDIETAELWWGDFIGEVDPFVDQVVAVQEARLAQPEFTNVGLVEQTTIEITAGGCYSDVGSTEVYRPSPDSLMNSEVPVFGSVNRRRVEEVLGRFSGRGPMASLDDLTLSCEARGGFVTCRGELASHLDKPLSIVAIESDPCEFGAARARADGSLAPVPVTCTTPRWSAEPVRLSFKSESAMLDVADLNPVLDVPHGLTVEAAAGASEPSPADTESAEEDGSNRTVAIGALLAAAAIVLAFVERRRSRNAERTSE